MLEAVRRCWALLWTAHAIGCRYQHNINQASIALAVVVQALVLVESAGILFTANPLKGRRDQVMINVRNPVQIGQRIRSNSATF